MELGTYVIPEVRLAPNCIADIKKVYDTIKNDDIQSNDLAKTLGYAAFTSGGFYRRLNSLIAYGLLEGRGKYRVSQLGQDIAYPHDEEHRKQLFKKVVLNIPLWAELYRKHGKTLPENIWVDLKNITGVPSPDAQKGEREVRKWYLEDIALVPDDVSGQETKALSSSESNTKASMSQASVLVENPDSGKLSLNVNGKNFLMDVDDKDSLEVAVATLNLLAKKLGLRIKAEPLDSL